MKNKKVVISSLGGPEVVKVSEFEVSEPKEEQVLVKIHYAGFAYTDLMFRKITMPGMPKLPFTPGAEFSGIVEKVGNNVSNIKPGDRVVGLMMSDFGCQSQYLCVDSNRVQKVPEDIPLDKAVCLIVNYLTAYDMFSLIPKQNSDIEIPILVHGGSGGVGSALIQLAVSKGIKVYATASDKNCEFVKELGAYPIDYKSTDFEYHFKNVLKQKVLAVFDPIGGGYLKRSLSILEKGGLYIAYGFQGDLQKGKSNLFKIMFHFLFTKLTTVGKKVLMYQLRGNKPSEYMDDIGKLFNLYLGGKIDPVISDVFYIDDIQQAHEKLERGDRRGKILIRMV